MMLIMIALALLIFSGITAVVMANITNSLRDTRKHLYTYAVDKFQKSVLISTANIWTEVSKNMIVKKDLTFNRADFFDFSIDNTKIKIDMNSTSVYLEMGSTPTLAVEIKPEVISDCIDNNQITPQGLMVIISEGSI